MTIEVLGLQLHGFHGVLPEERRAGQRFVVDLWLEPSDEKATTTDRVEDAVDYRDAVAIVREVCEGRIYNLLEALAAELADTLMDRLQLAAVRVRVCKPDVRLELPVGHAAAVVERRSSSL